MKPGMKMLMLTKGTEEHGRMERTRYPMTENYDGMEARRRRDSRGRYMRSDWDGDIYWEGDINEPHRKQMESNYPNRPFPVYREDTDMKYRGDRMNPIGFYAEGDEIRTDYSMNATHSPKSDMDSRPSSKMSGGYSSNMSAPITKEMAEEWTSTMKNEDGTKGAHWTLDQVKQVMAQKGIKGDPYEFYMVLNMIYSDYCAVLKKHRVNNLDVYVDLACAWLMDEDAVPDKASAYYEHVVKHA